MSATATTEGALLALLLAVAAAQAAPPEAPRLGKPVTPEAAARADPTVFPDGRGLPPGRGTPAEGAALYLRLCASCHGESGSGGNSGRLVGRAPLTASPWPDKTIGQYWPDATTLFDYLRRAMPIDRPGSLSDAESYALTAWLLHANGIVGADAVIDARSLPALRMPNREGFVRAEEGGR